MLFSKLLTRPLTSAVLEPAYNALAFNLGHRMPFTKNILLSQRPAGIPEHPLFVGFETLTNAKTPFPLGRGGKSHEWKRA